MSYKLTYFDTPGRGEPIRLLFALAKVKFNDNRIQKEDWPTLKQTLKWGQLPVLHVGDKEIAQSTTIMRFLARKFKLTGADEWEASRCDELVDAVNDIFGDWGKYFFATDPEKKEEAKKTLTTVTLPKCLNRLNTVQHENGGSFYVGKTVTWADVYIAQMFKMLEQTFDPDVLKRYPYLRKSKDTVFAIPEIKAYVEKQSK